MLLTSIDYSLAVGAVQGVGITKLATRVGLHWLLVPGQCFALELILSSELSGL